MPIPSLLTLGEHQGIPYQTFDDLQLRRLLDEKTIRILSYPAGKEELLQRQQLFSVMRTPDGLIRINDAFRRLKDYERAVRLWRSTSIEIEKRFLFASALSQYRLLCQTLASLSDCGEKLSAVAAYWNDAITALTNLDADLDEMQKTLSVIGSFNLSFAERAYMTRDEIPETVYDELSACAADLGLEMNDRRGARIRLNDGLSHAIAELHPEEVARFDALAAPYTDIAFDAPVAYIEEFNFYFAILALCDKADEMQIPICFPAPAEKRQYLAHSVYDISLFLKNAQRIVPNDTFFEEDAPFHFITGANGGGKTTYLRACGINLILFLGGCPVFAKDASIYPYTQVCSHFPADERFSSGGRLQEEKQRVDYLLSQCDADTFIVFNETYSGTDDKLGCEMTLETAGGIRERGTHGLFVTHFHEVRAGGYPMLNTVTEEDENHVRTFRIVRDLGITSSFADDILRKYRLDAASLTERRANA
ncbi:MAG: hypothetical protein IKZ09_04100 [Clostridia bacterium]|nr:hypothetical protein [Clostridia bacterium]